MKNINLVKIGSDAIVCKDNKHIKTHVIQKLFDDIYKYEQQTGESFIILSSGAIALGRAQLGDNTEDCELFEEGWNALIKKYQEIWGERKWVQSYLLRDKMSIDFEEYLINEIIDNTTNGCISIINHDDRLSDSESGKIKTKTDNDYNAYRLTSMINYIRSKTQYQISKVLFCTNTQGVLDFNNHTIGNYHVQNDSELTHISMELNSHLHDSVGGNGTGGMKSKIRYGIDCLRQGAEELYITDAKDGLDCLDDETIATKISYMPSIKLR